MVDRMRLIIIFCFGYLLFVNGARAESLYRQDITYFPADFRKAAVNALEALEERTEIQYLTQVGLENPEVFIRQWKAARLAISVAPDLEMASKKLRSAGFYSPQLHVQLATFFSSLGREDELTDAHMRHFLMKINDEGGYWDHLFSKNLSLDDFSALECAQNKPPTNFLGLPEYHYLMRVAFPNMELTLWRFDVDEAVLIPAAVVSATTLEAYQLIDRLGKPFGSIDRRTLIMTLSDIEVHCAKVDPAVMRAYQDFRRETIFSDKQL